MFNRINIDLLFQIAIELIIAILLILGLSSGNINLLIHPKFNILLWISSFLLILMAVFSISRLLRPRHMNILSKYFIVLTPILVCSILPMKNIKNDSSLNYQYSATNTLTSGENMLIPFKEGKDLKKIYKEEFGKDYINITNDMYLKWYYEITFNWKDFDGSNFKFLARVFKPKDNNEFIVLGRFGMICCMADLQPCGFIYAGNDIDKLKDGQWYYVTAKIKENNKYSFNYEKMPLAYDIKLEKAIKPIDEYVYIN